MCGKSVWVHHSARGGQKLTRSHPSFSHTAPGGQPRSSHLVTSTFTYWAIMLARGSTCPCSHLLILHNQGSFWWGHSSDNTRSLSNIAHYVHLNLLVCCSDLFWDFPQSSPVLRKAELNPSESLASLRSHCGEGLAYSSTLGMKPANEELSTRRSFCFQGQEGLSWYFLEKN